MDLQLNKISETSTTITLGWTPVSGAIGYRFQSSTGAPKWSHTWDATRSQVTFSKADWYKVEALGVAASGAYPVVTPPPPPTSDILFPRAFHIWGGDMDNAMKNFDVVVSLSLNRGRPAYWRANGNPGLIAMVNNGVAYDACPNYRTFAWTYGGGLAGSNAECGSIGPWPGANDTYEPFPSGQIRGYQTSDNCTCTQGDGINGFAVDNPSTAAFLRDAAWYGWKKYDGLGKGFNGLWSDNLVIGGLIKAGWFFGSACPIDPAKWDEGLRTIGYGLRQRGVPMVGGNVAFRTSDKTMAAMTQVALYETLQDNFTQGPDAFAGKLAEAMFWQKADTGPRYFNCMDLTPSTDAARMKAGLALATIMGGAYMPYEAPEWHASQYMPAEMTKNGQRHYLGRVVADPVRSGNTFSRQFENGTVSYNFDTKQAIFP